MTQKMFQVSRFKKLDFKSILQLKTERFWWVDTIFYFTVSMLIATVFCYVIFLAKNDMQRSEIEEHTVLLGGIGTKQQKEYEKAVISYQQKIKDFSVLFENHEFASRSFAFMQDQTMPKVWFRQFNLDRKNRRVKLFGQADDMEIFSRQVAGFESNAYVESVNGLNSGLGESARALFNISMDMKPELFSYVSDMNEAPLSETAVTNSSGNILQISEGYAGKMITVFNILLNPEVIGVVDQKNHTISAEVPYGTDIAHLTPLIITSRGAAVLPESSVAQDFSRPVVYKVTAGDDSSQNYTVTVNVLPQEPQKKNKYGFIAIYIIAGVVLVAVLVAFSIFLAKKLKNKKDKNNEA